jgi:hypothetical protein
MPLRHARGLDPRSRQGNVKDCQHKNIALSARSKQTRRKR